MSDALAGVKVLDAATVLAGPVSATILGDFGAEVVKIEDPKTGDFTRAGGRSPSWLQEGRNKKSVSLDLRTPAGQALLHRLVPRFDVVVTNFRPPTLERYRMLPAHLRPLNPRGIFLYLTGFGLEGPYRDRGAFDRIASAYSGLTYVTGEPGNPPVRSGYSVVDYMGAYLAAFSVVTALYHRDRVSGAGQVIDLALYEAALRSSEDSVTAFGLQRQVRERLGNKNPSIVPASDFETADGQRVSLHAGTDPLFRRLATVMNQPELAADARFAERAARVEHQDELYPLIGAWVSRLRADEVVKMLSDADIPASPIMSVADLMNDPHCRARGSVVTVPDPELGDIPMVAPLPRMSATPGAVRWAGTALGAHTDEVLGELLGLTVPEIDTLRENGVV
ncbi:CaiB/BaiF CoA transferase family protein [Amycolatopsis alkalitolerans]|uniref:CoA transferase n=1 Tax=Amycolatopsis alkalitolerans TaxID=2547244 RepID=A0A5C4LRS9_9PSEU|nr:CoA transferase [Amycolatopsis alkalitolerans]TNC20228.1 CoA transferase [Amycolatopsis alkalitolerans]